MNGHHPNSTDDHTPHERPALDCRRDAGFHTASRRGAYTQSALLRSHRSAGICQLAAPRSLSGTALHPPDLLHNKIGILCNTPFVVLLIASLPHRSAPPTQGCDKKSRPLCAIGQISSRTNRTSRTTRTTDSRLYRAKFAEITGGFFS